MKFFKCSFGFIITTQPIPNRPDTCTQHQQPGERLKFISQLWKLWLCCWPQLVGWPERPHPAGDKWPYKYVRPIYVHLKRISIVTWIISISYRWPALLCWAWEYGCWLTRHPSLGSWKRWSTNKSRWVTSLTDDSCKMISENSENSHWLWFWFRITWHRPTLCFL